MSNKRKTIVIETSYESQLRAKAEVARPVLKLYSRVKLMDGSYGYVGMDVKKSEKRAQEFHDFLVENASGAFYTKLAELVVAREKKFAALEANDDNSPFAIK